MLCTIHLYIETSMVTPPRVLVLVHVHEPDVTKLPQGNEEFLDLAGEWMGPTLAKRTGFHSVAAWSAGLRSEHSNLSRARLTKPQTLLVEDDRWYKTSGLSAPGPVERALA